MGNGGTDDEDHPVVAVDESNRPLRLGIRQLLWGCYDSGTCRRLGLTEFYENDGDGVWGQISSGGKHTCALSSTGKVLCWGGGAHGQLGNDGLGDTDHPVEVVDGDGSVNPLTNIAQLATGDDHTCALTNDGEVQCWGLGVSGQLGNDGTVDKDHPVTVVESSGSINPLKNIIQISSKSNHVCSVTSWGGVLCWGEGTGGELGNNDNVDKNHPVAVVQEDGGTGLLGDIVQVSSGWSHTCALTTYGEVRCWGSGDSGQLGNNSVDSKNHPVVVVATKESGEPLKNIIQISSGKEHTCALTVWGRVFCWGRGTEGQLGSNRTDNEYTPVEVVSGDANGTSLKNIIQINSGYEHTCARTSQREIFCWGNGVSGRLGDDDATDANKAYPVRVVKEAGSTDPLADIVEVSSSRDHTCALTSSGSVLCWGIGADGRLGNDGTDNQYAPVAVVERDGESWLLRLGVYERSWACYRGGICQEDSLPELYENNGGGVLSQLGVGRYHSCALTSTGEVRCWGEGTSGELGNDDVSSTDYPVTVVDGDGSTIPLGDIVQVSLGWSHTCALKIPRKRGLLGGWLQRTFGKQRYCRQGSSR